jgi:hypothetical protein
MRVKIDISALKEIKWYEYAQRFLLGGAITVLAGIIAKKYGPVVGGLFLAFPAIFPAGATLVEQKEKKKKECAGILHTSKGAQAAGIDAAGAAMGALGLVVFALITWKLLEIWPFVTVIAVATISWSLVAVVLWWMRKKHWLPI